MLEMIQPVVFASILSQSGQTERLSVGFPSLRFSPKLYLNTLTKSFLAEDKTYLRCVFLDQSTKTNFSSVVAAGTCPPSCPGCRLRGPAWTESTSSPRTLWSSPTLPTSSSDSTTCCCPSRAPSPDDTQHTTCSVEVRHFFFCIFKKNEIITENAWGW